MAELIRLMARDEHVKVTFYDGGKCCRVECCDRGVKMQFEGCTDTIVDILRDLGTLR